MAKIIISTDNVADYFKSEMLDKKIYYLSLKRIMNNKEYIDVFNSEKEYDDFYNDCKKGALPTTSQINPEEFITHFKEILTKEKEGDIIHISISSGLSGTHNSAVIAANELNKTLKDRKIYAVDSLLASAAMQIMVDKLIELRAEDKIDAANAVKIIEEIRDNTHAVFMVDDLKHLKRGGRLSAGKAFLGTMLGLKPILYVNKTGKIAAENKVLGSTRGVKYLLEMTQKLAEVSTQDYVRYPLYLLRTSESSNFELLKKLAKEKYPNGIVKEMKIGTIIGTHVGSGAVAVIFQGKPRLDIA